jgi:Holliday junction resolvase RusA-like endonuclease
MLLLEFVVTGQPVSHQSKNTARLLAWKNDVRAAAKAVWRRRKPLQQPLEIVVAYYHEGSAVNLDNDNLIKPIQDALNRVVYDDDVLITDIKVRKTCIDEPIEARRASLVLLEAFSRGDQFLHIVISDAPPHSKPLS